MLLVTACSAPQPDPPPVPAATAVHTLDLDGNPLDPLAQGDSAATALLFVSTHCPISNRYAPSLTELAESFAPRGVATWLVYPDPQDTPDKIRTHIAEFSLPTSVVRDPTHALVTLSEAKVTPQAAVFARGSTEPGYVGRIDDRVVEFGKVRETATRSELRDAIGAVLQGHAPKAAAGPPIGCYINDLR